MLCLAGATAHAVRALDIPCYPFASYADEKHAFQNCTASKSDLERFLRWPTAAPILQLQELFEHPELRDAYLAQRGHAASARNSNPSSVIAQHQNSLFNTLPAVCCVVSNADYVHRCKGLQVLNIAYAAPARSFMRVGSPQSELLITSPAMSLLLRARSVTEAHLAMVASELCGRFIIRPDLPKALLKRDHPLMTRDELMSYSMRVPPQVKGAERIKRAAALAFDNARSPREAALAIALSTKRTLGGAGLSRPVLNAEITLKGPGQKLLGINVIHPDLYWPSRQVALEYDSNQEHTDPDQALFDKNRIAALAYQGITCVSVTAHQVADAVAFGQLGMLVGRYLESRNIKPLVQAGRAFQHRRRLLRQIMSFGYRW